MKGCKCGQKKSMVGPRGKQPQVRLSMQWYSAQVGKNPFR